MIPSSNDNQTMAVTPIAAAHDARNLIRSMNVLFAKTDLNLGMRGTMYDDARDLVSAMLAIAYAAVLLVVGELYIESRSQLPTTLLPPQSDHAAPATRR
jgi:hypothetical protein